MFYLIYFCNNTFTTKQTRDIETWVNYYLISPQTTCLVRIPSTKKRFNYISLKLLLPSRKKCQHSVKIAGNYNIIFYVKFLLFGNGMRNKLFSDMRSGGILLIHQFGLGLFYLENQ